jgi:hypothetical protein
MIIVLLHHLHESFIFYYVTCNDVCYWHTVMYMISMIYVSVFIYFYFNFNVLVFWVGSPMSVISTFPRIWTVLPHAPRCICLLPHPYVLETWWNIEINFQGGLLWSLGLKNLRGSWQIYQISCKSSELSSKMSQNCIGRLGNSTHTGQDSWADCPTEKLPTHEVNTTGEFRQSQGS